MTVEVWNRLADGLLRWMLERGLVSACVLAVAFAAFLVLRARLRLTAPLFAAALVVLVLPLERLLPASLSVPAFARPVDLLADRIGPLPEVPAEAGPVEVVLTGDPAVERAPANAGPVPASATPGVRPTPGAWLALVWAAVAAALLGGLVRHQLRARRLVRSALPVDGPLADECARLARDIGVRRTVRCVESEELASPATWGVLRPVVALPLGLAATLAPAERRWILLHELHHVRRGDVLQQLGQRLLQIAWWFDPCVWLASRMVDRQRECLCDDDALRRLERRERTGGARAFVKVLEGARAAPAAPGLVGLWNEPRFVKRRLRRLLEDPTGPAAGRAFLALSVVVALALPAARSLVGPLPVATPGPDETAERAVAWLIAHQLGDGRWEAGHAKRREHAGTNDVGVTALAAMALLDAPSSSSDVDAAVAAAVRYLLVIQEAETGLLGDQGGLKFVYNHGYATLALARARVARAGLVPRARLQAAVDFIEATRNPRGGWRYGTVPDGQNDTSVTGLMLHALAAARDAGAVVDRSAFEDGLRYLDAMTDRRTGRTGYATKGRWSARLTADTAEAFPPDRTEALTAVALSARLAVGLDGAEAPELARSFARLDARPPEWAGGGVDFYYWWYGTEAMRRLGGEAWIEWRDRLVETLTDRQTTAGEAAGSWPAEDAWSGLGGRVYATALNLLSLRAATR